MAVGEIQKGYTYYENAYYYEKKLFKKSTW